MITRRAGLQLLTGATCSAVMAPHVLLASTVDSWRETVVAYARIRGDLPDRLGIWRYSGTIFAARDDDVQAPLLGVEGASFNRLEVMPDGSLEQAITEAGYITDLESGAVLESWVNPLNGRTCKPHHYQLVQKITWTDSGMRLRDTRMQPVESLGRLGPMRTEGDTVWITENFSNRYDVDGQTLIGTSMATFTAQRAGLDEPRAWIPAHLTYHSFGGFVPWMQMAGESGSCVWQLAGRKVRGIDELPSSYRERAERDHPGWLSAPPV